MPGIAYVGEAGIPGQNELGAAAIPYTSSGGTLILAGLFYDGANSPCLLTSITDTAGNTWDFATSVSQSPPQSEEYDGSSQYITTFVAWCINASPITSVTINRTDSGSNWWRVTLAEFSGIGSLHSAASNSAASGTAPSATLTVSAGDLVIGAADAINNVPGMPTGWTAFTSSGSICNGYDLSAPAGSYTPTWGLAGSDHWAVAVASFSPAGGTQQGAAAFSAAAALTAAAHNTVLPSAPLVALSTLGAGARDTVLPAVHLSSSPALTAAGRCTALASAHLAAVPALGASGVRGRTGQAALSGGGVLSGSALLTRRGIASLAGPGVLAASAHRGLFASASLASAPVLLAVAAAGVSLASLWNAYQAAQAQASAAWAEWKMMRSVAATDGTAGFIYGKAYEAQQLADAAYKAYTDALEHVFPGARG